MCLSIAITVIFTIKMNFWFYCKISVETLCINQKYLHPPFFYINLHVLYFQIFTYYVVMRMACLF